MAVVAMSPGRRARRRAHDAQRVCKAAGLWGVGPVEVVFNDEAVQAEAA